MVAIRIYFLLLLSLGLCAGNMHAQQTQVYVAPDADFRKGLDLFEKQKYEAAQVVFDEYVRTHPDKKNLYAVDAEYYSAICALELFHKDAEWRLNKFIEHHPESQKIPGACFQLARYYFRKKEYRNVLVWMEKVDFYNLRKEETAEFYFKRGYSHYMLEHVDSAKKDFYEIKDVDTKYSAAANYYFSHIAYIEGNYETALQGFQRLVSNESFGPVVPFYIAQIYYLQKRYDQVILYAPPLLDSADKKRQPQIARIIGESYYRTGKFRESIPYLQRYRKGVAVLTREEAYELGYAYYRSDSAAQAAEYFQQVMSDTADLLEQNAWYHLADCNLKQNNKVEARAAFGKASALKFDPAIREDALFNFARLSYELSLSPYNEAIVALQSYLDQYPNTPRADEAYTLLTNVYLSNKNYALGLQSISRIKVLKPSLHPVYQQMAYNRAVELYQQGDYTGAVKHFDMSLTYPVSRDLAAQARYWKGEAWYQNGEKSGGRETNSYDKAIAEYKAFQLAPGASLQPNFNLVNYNIAYCYFEKGDWENAVLWFRKYVALPSGEQSETLMDADLRMGDAYFRMKDYVNAAEFYGKAVAEKTGDNNFKDYALFQQAMAFGYLGRKSEKADLLKQLRTNYPNSKYLASSRFQEARALHDLRRYDEALLLYENVNKIDPESNEGKLSLVNMGLIYRAKNEQQKALEQFKKAANAYRNDGTGQLPGIMREIKEIYVALGQLDQWEAYSASQGFAESQQVADSTTFVVADRFYKEGNCPEALKQLNKYILKYPSGSYITDVHFMRAECSFKEGDTITALGSYVAVINKGRTRYSEQSLARASFIYFRTGDYRNAIKTYKRLQKESSDPELKNSSTVNLMLAHMNLNEYDSAAVYAPAVLEVPKLPNSILVKAHYLRGRQEFANLNDKDAEVHFNKVIKMQPLTDFAAEASYSILVIKYRRKEYKKVEKEGLKFVSDYAGYPQWSGRAMLLLADNYLAMKDKFQAKLVLQNYIDNGDVPELVQQAKDKLAAIEAEEKAVQRKAPEELEIPIETQEGGGQ